jgi:hypothetical protein
MAHGLGVRILTIAFAQRSMRCVRSAGSRSDFTWRWTAIGRFVFLRTTDFDFAMVARRRFFARASAA